MKPVLGQIPLCMRKKNNFKKVRKNIISALMEKNGCFLSHTVTIMREPLV